MWSNLHDTLCLGWTNVQACTYAFSHDGMRDMCMVYIRTYVQVHYS